MLLYYHIAHVHLSENSDCTAALALV